ncbi:MAG: glycoside hydrolase family 20 zincin-like fold domain-containing protein [Bacteroidota bacterium]
MKHVVRIVLTALIILVAGNYLKSFCSDKTLIFPIPLKVLPGDGNFVLDSSTALIVTGKEKQGEAFVLQLLQSELSDRYGLALPRSGKSGAPKNQKFILIGTLDNPSVRRFCDANGLTPELKNLGAEGYILSVSGSSVVIASNRPNGALFGFESLRQIMKKENGRTVIPQIRVIDKPLLPFRGIKLYLPGRENIQFFKRFVRDFAASFKYNTIIVELNANMRLDRHPELNIGTMDFAKALLYSRLSDPHGLNNVSKNSTHWDNADGGILEKEEVADLVRYMRQFNMEVIPELPSLAHSYYLLFGHRDLAANKPEVYPDTYCPLNPDVYKLYFDILDEYIDVIHPRTIHVGHDEWRVDKSECEDCQSSDYGLMYANDLRKIHDHLAGNGIKVAIWGDHLIESVRGKGEVESKTSTGYKYKLPGALSPEQVKALIPKDILVFNWFWDDRYERNIDSTISKWGFKQVYGNMRADMNHWDERTRVRGMIGGEPSSWAGTTEMNFGKDQLVNFLGCANLLWSERILPFDSLVFTFEPLVHDVKRNLSGKVLPSDDGFEVKTLDISASFNSSLHEGMDSLNTAQLRSGEIRSGNRVFKLPEIAGHGNRAVSVVTSKTGSGSPQVNGIPINGDVSSIVFLQACARNAANRKAYYEMYNFDDTADLLGWYEVVYEDGFIMTIPIRYGVNVMDWSWRQRIARNERETVHYNQDKYAYEADAVDCSLDSSNPITFFSYEWRNPRFGEQIREINLKAVKYNKNNENGIILLGVSIVPAKDILPDLTRSTK